MRWRREVARLREVRVAGEEREEGYVVRQFWKAVQEDGFLVVEVCLLSFLTSFNHLTNGNTPRQTFFPKNRNRWKQFSSWEAPADEKERGGRKRGKDEEDGEAERPAEVKVKKGYTWSQQLGIAIACLVEKGQKGLVDWVREVRVIVFFFYVSVRFLSALSV